MKDFSNSQQGFGLIVVAILIGALGVVYSYVSSDAIISSKKFAVTSIDQLDGQRYNRSAIHYLKDRWHQGEVGLTVSAADLALPSMYRSLAAVGGGSSAATWEITGTGASARFFLRRCPTDTKAAAAVFTKEAVDCVADGTAVVTMIRAVRLIENRNTVLIEAKTSVNNKENVTQAILLVPQWQHSVDSECKLEVNGAPNASVQVNPGDSVNFRLSFSPQFVSGLSLEIDGVQVPVAPSSLTTSPFDISRVFPAKATPYEIHLKTTGGPVPCEISAKITTGMPPAACKWADVNYFEDMDIIGCNYLQGKGYTKLTSGVLKARIGPSQGQPAALAGHSLNLADCSAADACRLIYYKDGRIPFNANVATGPYCQENSRGTLPAANLDAHIIAMFRSTGGQCQTKIVLGRSSVDGCLLPSAKIQMADGKVKRIDEIATGEFVWNPIQGRGVRVASLKVGVEKDPMIRISTSLSSIDVTSIHPIRSKGMVKAARDLKEGDFITLRSMADQKIVKVASLPVKKNEVVWNLVLEPENHDSNGDDDQYFIADGVVVGDWFLQSKLVKAEKSQLTQAVK